MIERRMLVTCAYCTTWSRTVNFTAPDDPDDQTKVTIASMGAAVFNHELLMHTARAHPGIGAGYRQRELR